MAKHVIFLGAGASKSSGYPIASELRQNWLGSPDLLFSRALQELNSACVPQEPDANRPPPLDPKVFQNLYQKISKSLNMLREGGFGSVDEFCYHVRSKNPELADPQRIAMRYALGMVVSEARYQTSDYYRFIQKLFVPDKLSKLRDDIAVFSFNYDPYLEWLLTRAIKTRALAIGENSEAHERQLMAVASGFVPGGNLNKFRTDRGFCVLKLHGSIAWASPKPRGAGQEKFTFSDAFELGYPPLHDRLCSDFYEPEVPIVFPWEIIDPRSGGLMAKNKFRFSDEIYSVFRAIWHRARREISEAERVSFIGISFHSYTLPALKHLFANRDERLVWDITDAKSAPLNPNGFRAIVPNVSITRRAINFMANTVGGPSRDPVSVYADFADYLENGLSDFK